MVFVSMGQNNRSEFFTVFPEVVEIGNDQVHAGHVVVGEHEARIHNHHMRTVLKDHHVEADFPESPQWYDFQHNRVLTFPSNAY